jgi:hypothetical protein
MAHEVNISRGFDVDEADMILSAMGFSDDVQRDMCELMRRSGAERSASAERGFPWISDLRIELLRRRICITNKVYLLPEVKLKSKVYTILSSRLQFDFRRNTVHGKNTE